MLLLKFAFSCEAEYKLMSHCLHAKKTLYVFFNVCVCVCSYLLLLQDINTTLNKETLPQNWGLDEAFQLQDISPFHPAAYDKHFTLLIKKYQLAPSYELVSWKAKLLLLLFWGIIIIFVYHVFPCNFVIIQRLPWWSKNGQVRHHITNSSLRTGAINCQDIITFTTP